MTTPLRVLLAEDDILLREGVASLLARSGIEVVGRPTTPRNCCRWFGRNRPMSWWSTFACRPRTPPRDWTRPA